MAIKIKESKKGTFTAAAKKRGMAVQEFARKVMANKDKYSTAMVRKANFAKNATKFKHELGGILDSQVGTQNQQLGSTIGSTIGSAAALAGIPGLGPLLGSLGSLLGKKPDELKVLSDHFKSINTSTNPYGNYEMGGELEGLEGALKYSGASHDQGGIDVNAEGIPSSKPIAEVEDGEVVYSIKGKKVIFSNTLKI